jgi:DnaJ-class molecular chaperone
MMAAKDATRDLYAVLGLNKAASDADIKKAYRTLARELHPDRNPGNTEAEERFKQVGSAYQVLSDPDKRKLYDEFGEAGLREGFDPEAYRKYQQWHGGGREGVRVEDLFGGAGRGRQGFRVSLDDLFGGFGQGTEGGGVGDFFGGFGRRRRPPARGADLRSDVTVDLSEALRGAQKELSFSVPGAPGGVRTLKVRIPAGVRDGERIRLRDQGMSAQGGGEPGDLLLTVHVRSHPHFWREGNDLHLNLPVTALEAYRGARVPVPTVDGEVTLTVPPGTQSGSKLRLRGKGAPDRAGGRGDLYVHVHVRLPEREDPRASEVEAVLEQLSEGQPNPREGLSL